MVVTATGTLQASDMPAGAPGDGNLPAPAQWRTRSLAPVPPSTPRSATSLSEAALLTALSAVFLPLLNVLGHAELAARGLVVALAAAGSVVCTLGGGRLGGSGMPAFVLPLPYELQLQLAAAATAVLPLAAGAAAAALAAVAVVWSAVTALLSRTTASAAVGEAATAAAEAAVAAGTFASGPAPAAAYGSTALMCLQAVLLYGLALAVPSPARPNLRFHCGAQCSTTAAAARGNAATAAHVALGQACRTALLWTAYAATGGGRTGGGAWVAAACAAVGACFWGLHALGLLSCIELGSSS